MGTNLVVRSQIKNYAKIDGKALNVTDEFELQNQESSPLGDLSLAGAREVVKIISSHVRNQATEKQIRLDMGSPEILQADDHHTEGKENIVARFVSPQEQFSLQLGFQ